MNRPTPPLAVHGARDYKELTRLGLNPDTIVDFSANSNPYGPHPAVLGAVKAAVTSPTVAHYPDRDCLFLQAAIAASENVNGDNILPTNGASELIQLIALAFIDSDSRHLILTPTFGEYSRAIQLMGGNSLEYRPAGSNLQFKADLVAEAIQKHQPDTIWLCNPNNPTGQHWTMEHLTQLHTAAPQALWIIDESYRYFVRPPSFVTHSLPKNNPKQIEHLGQELALPAENVIIIRSLTKEHGLAGLRLGYAIAAPERIAALRAVQPPWSVNSLAQVAGVAALQPEVLAWRDETLAQLHQHAAGLWAQISALGLTVLPTDTTYTLVRVGNAAEFRRRLLTHNFLVRDCASFGLPEYVRIAAQLPEENEQLIQSMSEK